MCHFIEWFYLQLSVEQRRTLDDWPRAEIALALIYEPQHNKPELDDIVIGASVINKLHHVDLFPEEVCDRCIIEGGRPAQDARVRVRTIEEPRGPLKDGNPKRIEEEHRMQQLVSACVASDAECLLNYTSSLQNDALQKRIEGSIKELGPTVRRWTGMLDINYPELKEVLQRLSRSMDASNPRMMWLKALEDVVDLS